MADAGRTNEALNVERGIFQGGRLFRSGTRSTFNVQRRPSRVLAWSVPPDLRPIPRFCGGLKEPNLESVTIGKHPYQPDLVLHISSRNTLGFTRHCMNKRPDFPR
jgi:hypothetical protein